MAYPAEVCPWQNWSGAEFYDLDINPGYEKSLNASQVREDLDCLRILFLNVYAYNGVGLGHALVKRLDGLSDSAQAMSNSAFADQVFSIHSGFIDTHLSYQVANREWQFSGSHNPRVTLSEDFEVGKIIDRGSFVYFKTGDVHPPITESQNEFIDFVRNRDRNLVIDLRSNGGGDDAFAQELAKVLFAADEPIPNTTKNQLLSPLGIIGFCLTLATIYGPEMGGGKEYCDQVRTSVSGLPFERLTPHTFQAKTDSLRGSRPLRYQSKIYLIIDPTCASSCETIVEKLSAHSRVVTIGQPTYGALHFSNAGTFILPNSGMVVRLPTLRQDYENDAGEGVGYQPQIPVTDIDLGRLRF